MSKFTPTIEYARTIYARAMRQAFIASIGEHREEFNRMIAEVERAAAARALEEAADDLRRPDTGAGYDAWASGVGDWLRARAAEIRGEQ